jgi:Bax protein
MTKYIFLIIRKSLIILYTLLLICSCSNQASKPNFKKIKNIKARKIQYIDFIVPYIKIVKNNILNQKRILNEAIKNNDSIKIKELAFLYNVPYYQKQPQETIDQLKLRINTIPTSIVIAQSALESGWGTSRFAQYGNNYFGIHCFTPNCGIKPYNSKNNIMQVQSFESPLGSIRKYFHLLNTSKRFDAFRRERYKLYQNNKQRHANIKLLNSLIGYSELNSYEYQKRIIDTIQNNNLMAY